MANTRKRVVSVRPTESEDRNRAESSGTRPERVPVSGGYRNILTVDLRKDVARKFATRWVKDTSHGGGRILRFQRGGWTLVTRDEIETIGEDRIQKVEGLGDVVAIPAGKEYTALGSPMFLYLMKIPRELYEEDQENKERELASMEANTIHKYTYERDTYGNMKITQN